VSRSSDRWISTLSCSLPIKRSGNATAFAEEGTGRSVSVTSALMSSPTATRGGYAFDSEVFLHRWAGRALCGSQRSRGNHRFQGKRVGIAGKPVTARLWNSGARELRQLDGEGPPPCRTISPTAAPGMHEATSARSHRHPGGLLGAVCDGIGAGGGARQGACQDSARGAVGLLRQTPCGSSTNPAICRSSK